jgi:hypothetical protein
MLPDDQSPRVMKTNGDDLTVTMRPAGVTGFLGP